jgi:SSS family solute:Na+ symporter
MSTLDSTYNAISTVIAFDIYKRFIQPGCSDELLEKKTRRLSLLVAAVVVIPALFAISNESVLKLVASMTSIFVGIRLGSFVVGLAFDRANEKGIIIGSLASVIAIYLCRINGIAWPWFAPIGTISFVLFAIFTSHFWGQNSPQQLEFIQQQKALYARPTLSQWGLLIFAAITLLLCFFIPDWLYLLLS